MSDNEIINKIQDFKVLYIEDDDFQMQQTLSILSIFFTTIKTSKDGKEALDIFKQGVFDLVISDIMLPKMSGIQLAQEIRSIDENINLIFISSTTDLNHFKQIVQIQALDILIKPYSFEDLKDVLLKFGKKILSGAAAIIYFNEEVGYDKINHCLMVNETVIELTQKEQKLIQLATQFRKKTITYNQISIALNYDEININSIKNIILRLRKKLPSDIFLNVSGVGYRVV